MAALVVEATPSNHRRKQDYRFRCQSMLGEVGLRTQLRVSGRHLMALAGRGCLPAQDFHQEDTCMAGILALVNRRCYSWMPLQRGTSYLLDFVGHPPAEVQSEGQLLGETRHSLASVLRQQQLPPAARLKKENSLDHDLPALVAISSFLGSAP